MSERKNGFSILRHTVKALGCFLHQIEPVSSELDYYKEISRGSDYQFSDVVREPVDVRNLLTPHPCIGNDSKNGWIESVWTHKPNFNFVPMPLDCLPSKEDDEEMAKVAYPRTDNGGRSLSYSPTKEYGRYIIIADLRPYTVAKDQETAICEMLPKDIQTTSDHHEESKDSVKYHVTDLSRKWVHRNVNLYHICVFENKNYKDHSNGKREYDVINPDWRSIDTSEESFNIDRFLDNICEEDVQSGAKGFRDYVSEQISKFKEAQFKDEEECEDDTNAQKILLKDYVPDKFKDENTKINVVPTVNPSYIALLVLAKLIDQVKRIIEDEHHQKVTLTPKCHRNNFGSFIGQENAIKTIQDLIAVQYYGLPEFIKMLKITREYDADIQPPHTLFQGPPGTGKTMLVKLMAENVGRPVVHVGVESVLSKYTSKSVRNFTSLLKMIDLLHSLIAPTKLDGPGAFIFFDEFDSLAQSRDSMSRDDGDNSCRGIVNALLTWLEGFDTKLDRSQPWIMAATNLYNTLDSAVVSRFTNTVEFTPPTAEHLKSMVLKRIENLHMTDEQWMTCLTELKGRTGRDIDNICERAKSYVLKRLVDSKEGKKLIKAIKKIVNKKENGKLQKEDFKNHISDLSLDIAKVSYDDILKAIKNQTII